MKIIFDGKGKAKWIAGDNSGRWQKIKSDAQGTFIRKGTETIYFNQDLIEGKQEKNKGRGDEENKIELSEDNLFIFDAFHETKYFWDKKHGDVAPRDYYYYRNQLQYHKRSFFNKK